MVLNETIRQCLQHCAVAKDASTLQHAFAALQHAVQGRLPGDRPSGDLYVEFAEAAIQVKEFGIAKQCLDLFFLETRRYTDAHNALADKSSISVRARFALAKVISNATQHLKGEDLVTGTKSATKQVLQGIELAKGRPRYAFLLYNGTVHFWHVAQPLMRAGLWQHLQEPLAQLLPCLSQFQGHTAWKSRIYLANALALQAAGKLDDALKQVDAALASVPAEEKELRNEATAIKAHLGAATGKGKLDGKETPVTAAQIAVQTVMTTKMTADAARTLLSDALKKLIPEGTALAQSQLLMEVAMIGWAAATSGNFELAETAASRAATSQNLRPRAWSDLIRAHQAVTALDSGRKPNARDALTAAAVRGRTDALDALEKCVMSFTALHDEAGVHGACRLVWNAALPLLQHNLHARVKRAFTTAAKALSDLRSPLTRLRAQLHAELALCDVDDDLVSSAKTQTALALAQDYLDVPADVAHFQYTRPLDRHLMPLARALDLKSNMYDDPTTARDWAVLYIERAREAKSAALQDDYLRKAVAMLETLPMAQAPESVAAASGVGGAAAHHAARDLMMMWAGIVKVGWKRWSHALVCIAAPRVQWFVWSADVDREMVLLQAECSYIEAEACVALLKQAGEEAVMPLSGGEPVMDETCAGLRKPLETDEQAQALIGSALARGMQLAHACHEPWCVLNGAIYAWNIFLPYIVQRRYVEIKGAVSSVVEQLLRLGAADQSGRQLCDLAVVAMNCHEHAYLLKVMEPPKPEADADADPDPDQIWPCYRPGCVGYHNLADARVLAKKAGDLAARPGEAEARAQLKLALPMAETALKGVGDAPCQALVEAYARTRQLVGMSADIASVVSPSQQRTTKVVSIVEDVTANGRKKPWKEVNASIQGGISALKQLTTRSPELWAKLARAAHTAGAHDQALECAQAAVAAVLSVPADKVRAMSDAANATTGEWFWLAVAEHVQARTLLGRVKPALQHTLVQVQLRVQALGHAVNAARFGAFAGREDVVEAAARTAVNACHPLASCPTMQSLLVDPLTQACKALNSAGAVTPAFQGRINSLLYTCLIGTNQVAAALKHSGSLVRSMPQKGAASVWALRIEMLRGAGAPVAAEMGALGSYPDEMQAAAWLSVAQRCPGELVQLQALRRCIAVISLKPWLQAEYYAAYAEWVMTRGSFDTTQSDDVAREALTEAARLLLSMDKPFDADDDEDGDAAAAAGAKGVPRSNATTQRPPAGSQAASSRAHTRRTGATASCVKSSTRASKGKSGATPIPEEPHAPSCLEPRQLELLVRVFLLRAHIAPDSLQRLDCLLAAHNYALRLLRTALLAAMGQADASGRQRAPSAGTETLTLPLTLAGWAAFGASVAADKKWDSLAAASASKSAQRQALTLQQVPRPERTLHWLAHLCQQLRANGLHLHALPVTLLQHFIARTLVSSAAGSSYLLPLSESCEEVGLAEAAASVRAAAGDVGALTADDEAALAQEIELRQMVSDALAMGAAGVQRPRSGMPAAATSGDLPAHGRPALLGASHKRITLEFGRRSARHSASPFVNESTAASSAKHGGLPAPASALSSAMLAAQGASDVTASTFLQGLAAASLRLEAAPSAAHGRHDSSDALLPLDMRQVLLLRAEYLAGRGCYSAASTLLGVVTRHAAACGDIDAHARSLVKSAQLEALARRPDRAVELIQQAQGLGGGMAFWAELICSYAKYRCQAGQGWHDALSAVRGGIAMLNSVARTDRGTLRGSQQHISTLQLKLADLQLGLMSWAQENGMDGAQECEAAVCTLRQAVQDTANAGGCALIDALAALIAALRVQSANNAHGNPDTRAHLHELSSLSAQASAECCRLLQATAPADLPAAVHLPLQARYTTLLQQQADCELAIAEADARFAQKDQERQRPAFPRVAGPDSSPVLAYLDATLPEALAEQRGSNDGAKVSHADQALLLAGAALAAGRSAAVIAACQCTMGRVYAHKALAAAAGTTCAAWPEALGAAPALSLPGQSVAAADEPEAHDASGAKPEENKQQDAVEAAAPGNGEESADKVGDAARSSGSILQESPAAAAAVLREASTEEVALVDSLQQQAAACLHAGIQSALAIGDANTVGAATRCLVQLYGQAAPSETAAAIALAQSSQALQATERMLHDVAPQAHLEVLLQRQRDHLAANLLHPEHNALFQSGTAVLAAVGRLPAWSALRKPLDDALKVLPPSVRTVCLHLDTATETMYLVACNLPSEGLDAGAAQPVAVARAPYSPQQLQKLVGALEAWDQRCAQALVQGAKPTDVSDSAAQWRALLGTAEALLKPFEALLLRAAEPAMLTDRVATPGKKAKPADKGAPPPPPAGPHLVLCLHEHLAPLPLEALPCFAKASAVSRDFGVHLLADRIALALARPLTVSASDMRALVDVHAEHADEHVGSPGCSSSLRSMVAAVGAGKLDTAKAGIVGEPGQQPSQGQYTASLQGTQGWLFCGVGALPRYFSIPSIAAADLGGLSAALVLDRICTAEVLDSNAVARQRQTAAVQACWQPHKLATLLLARGAACAAVTMRSSTVDAAAVNLTAILDGSSQALSAVLRAATQAEGKLNPAMPWLQHNVAVYGLPTIAVEAGDSGKKAKKK